MTKTVEKFIANVNSSINKTISTLEIETLQKACECILEHESNGGRVHVTGIGKPGHVASYIASLLSSTGTPSYFLDATEAVHGSSGQVKKGDVVIAISNSGETKELAATVQTLNKNGATVIATTRSHQSWLANNAAICLVAAVDQEGDSLNKPPRASILSEIIVLQCLSVLLQEAKGVTIQAYLDWHPGGSLGEMIRKETQEGE